MARGPLLFARVVRPVRSLWQRFAFATLIGMALSLMVADQSDIKVFKQIKMSAIHSVGTLLELGVETSAAAREMAVDGCIEPTASEKAIKMCDEILYDDWAPNSRQ